jgi:hypothetical protein
VKRRVSVVPEFDVREPDHIGWFWRRVARVDECRADERFDSTPPEEEFT